MMLPAINQQQVRQHFSGHASEYDLYARVQKRVARRLIELIDDDFLTGSVLDVGTGTGEAVRQFRQQAAGGSVVVSDLAHDMTLTAHRSLPNSRAVDADARDLPFKNGSFDLLLSSSVFQWIDQLPMVFRECARILKPGGCIAFAMFCEGTLQELGKVFSEALDNCNSDWPDHFQQFPSLDAVESALWQSGLIVDNCHVEIETDSHASFRSLMRGLKKIGAQNASQNRPAGLFPRKVMAEMERLYIEKYKTEQGLPASYGVLYGLARKR